MFVSAAQLLPFLPTTTMYDDEYDELDADYGLNDRDAMYTVPMSYDQTYSDPFAGPPGKHVLGWMK